MIALLLASTLYIGTPGPQLTIEEEIKKHVVLGENGQTLAAVTMRTGTAWEDKPKWVYEFKDAKEAFKVLWEEGYQKRCTCPYPINSWYGGAQTLGNK